MAVIFQPNQPPGTQLLKQGYLRIQDINNNLITMFGAPLTGDLTFGAPFSFFDAAAQTAGRLTVLTPVNDGEIVNKAYADSKLITATDLTPDITNTVYTGTAVPAVTAYVTNGLYVITNTGAANAGPVSIDLGAGIRVLLHLDGTNLQAGDLLANQMALLAYDGTAFRLVNFMGGTLSVEPTLPTSATTKQYVDKTINPPVTRAGMAQPTIGLTVAGADLIIPPVVTIPDDGPYVLFVDWLAYVNQVVNAAGDAESDIALWVVDDQTPANYWAFGSNAFRGTTSGTGGAHTMLGGSGFGPISYPASSTVQLKLQGAITGSAVNLAGSTVQQAPFGTFGPAALPSTYLTVTLMRTH